MDFDWNNPPFNLNSAINIKDIEESFEDPFAVRLLPDSPRFAGATMTTRERFSARVKSRPAAPDRA